MINGFLTIEDQLCIINGSLTIEETLCIINGSIIIEDQLCIINGDGCHEGPHTRTITWSEADKLC